MEEGRSMVRSMRYSSSSRRRRRPGRLFGISTPIRVATNRAGKEAREAIEKQENVMARARGQIKAQSSKASLAFAWLTD